MAWPGRAPGRSCVSLSTLVFVRPYGLGDVEAGSKVTTDTQFQLMSVSKSFTATGLALLVDERGAWPFSTPRGRCARSKYSGRPSHPGQEAARPAVALSPRTTMRDDCARSLSTATPPTSSPLHRRRSPMTPARALAPIPLATSSRSSEHRSRESHFANRSDQNHGHRRTSRPLVATTAAIVDGTGGDTHRYCRGRYVHDAATRKPRRSACRQHGPRALGAAQSGTHEKNARDSAERRTAAVG